MKSKISTVVSRCLEIRCQTIDALATKNVEPRVLVISDVVSAEGKTPWFAGVNPGCVDSLLLGQVIEQCSEGQSVKLKPLQLAGMVP